MASSSAKATYKTNGYNTWRKSDSDVAASSGVSTTPSGPQSSSSLSFLKSWFGPSPVSSPSKSIKDMSINPVSGDSAGAEAALGPTGSAQAAKGAQTHQRIDSLDIGRRLGQCYAQSAGGARRESVGTSNSSGKGRSDHSQLSLATQLSLSSSGKISRSGLRPKIDPCGHRRRLSASCDSMFKYNNEFTRQAVTPSGGGVTSPGTGPATGGIDPKAKQVVVMECGL